MPPKGYKTRIFSEEDKLNIIDMYKKGVTKSQIRKIYKCRSSCIADILKDVHSDNVATKKPMFSKNIEEEICEMYLTGKYNKKFIAEKYGCCVQTIVKVLKNNNVEIENHKIYHFKDTELKEDYFSKIDSEEKAYFLGFIFADGCVYTGKNNDKNCLTLEINIRDIEILYKFKQALNSNNAIRYKKKSRSEMCVIGIYSKQIIQDLSKYGIVQNKTKVTKHIPIIPEPYKRHFLRGIFDGDGSFTVDKNGYYHVGYVANYESMALDFREECNSLIQNKGYNKILLKGKTGTGYVCTFTGTERVKQLMTALYKDSDIYLTRKKQKVECFFNESNDDEDIV